MFHAGTKQLLSHSLHCASPSTLSSGTYCTSHSVVSHVHVLEGPFLPKVPVLHRYRSLTFSSPPASVNFIIEVLWSFMSPCQSSNVSPYLLQCPSFQPGWTVE